MDDSHRRPQIQMGFLTDLANDAVKDGPTWQREVVLSIAREIVHELMNIGALYPGQRGQVHGSDFYPWLTITDYGKELFSREDWLPYDPDGYLKALRAKVPEIDEVTLAYAGESGGIYIGLQSAQPAVGNVDARRRFRESDAVAHRGVCEVAQRSEATDSPSEEDRGPLDHHAV
jgi:hypothetical protein